MLLVQKGFFVICILMRDLGALTKSGKTLGVRSFYSGDPDVITWSCQSVWLRNNCSWAWHTHLLDAMADSASLLNQAQVQYQSATGGSTVEKSAKAQTSNRLSSHLVWARNSRSGGHVLHPQYSGNSMHWLRSFYSGDPHVITWSVCLAA